MTFDDAKVFTVDADMPSPTAGPMMWALKVLALLLATSTVAVGGKRAATVIQEATQQEVCPLTMEQFIEQAELGNASRWDDAAVNWQAKFVEINASGEYAVVRTLDDEFKCVWFDSVKPDVLFQDGTLRFTGTLLNFRGGDWAVVDATILECTPPK